MRLAIQTLLACAGFLMATCGHVYAGLITVTSHTAIAGVEDFVTQQHDADIYSGTAFDGLDHTITGTMAGGTYATTVNFSEQALGATLSYNFGGSTLDLPDTNGMGAIAVATVRLTANGDNLLYSLSGNYSYLNEPPNSGGVSANFNGTLFDVTANSYLFRNAQSSLFTNPIAFTLGGMLGDTPALLEGSLGGALINGHEYEFSFTADSRYGNTTSSGNVVLTITSQASAVPEPASLTLVGLGTLGAAFIARHRRRRAVSSIAA